MPTLKTCQLLVDDDGLNYLKLLIKYLKKNSEFWPFSQEESTMCMVETWYLQTHFSRLNNLLALSAGRKKWLFQRFLNFFLSVSIPESYCGKIRDILVI